MKRTQSRRDQVFAHLAENPDARPEAVAKALGINSSTAYRWVGQYRKERKMSDTVTESQQAEGDEQEQQAGDDVVVSRAYLATLEALRDQVLETQRLRRALDGR